MTDPVYDVVGVGNAIVDVISVVDDDFIEDYGLVKGAMTLIDAERALELHDAMPPGIETSGGSAANTVAGVASFGGRAAFIGKVRDDGVGSVFADDLRLTGVAFDAPFAIDGPPTARCLIQVTPDAQRTMNTFLGVSALLEPGDIDTDLVASAAILYCEGYLWDVDVAKQAIRKAMDAAYEANRTVALTLSDRFCVDRHRDDWLELISHRVDVVFANETEIESLFEVDDWKEAARRAPSLCDVVVLTRSEKGSVIIAGDEWIVIEPEPVTHVVDSTGAGDLYASGFLHGLTHGLDLRMCGRLASAAAAEVISHVGARAEIPLTSLVGKIRLEASRSVDGS